MYDTMHTNFYADTIFLNKHLRLVHRQTGLQFRDENGRLVAEGRYRNGIPDGFWKYYANGKLDAAGKYVEGLKDSIWHETFMEASVYHREYKNGEFTYREKFFFDGRLASERKPTDDGRRWVECHYHNNGKPRFIAYESSPKRDALGNLKEPKFDGPFKSFSETGIVLETGSFANGFSVGRWRYFYKSGKLRMEGSYKQGDKSSVWKIYHANGRIKATGSYLDDVKAADWKYFDEAGRAIRPDPAFIEKDEDPLTYN